MLDRSKIAVAVGLVALVLAFMTAFSWLDIGAMWDVGSQIAPWVALALFVRFGCGACCSRGTRCSLR